MMRFKRWGLVGVVVALLLMGLAVNSGMGHSLFAPPTPTATWTATATASPLPTLTPTPTWTATPSFPPATMLQGIPMDSLIVIPNVDHVRAIYALGRAFGRNPGAFSKLGDSTIENPHFLTRFDEGPYNLGSYSYLQGIIDSFRGSFGRQGVAVIRGLHSWSALDPMWADKSVCWGGETPIACEIRINNPSYIFIRLGSNDVDSSVLFEQNMRKIVEFCVSNGVIPLIGTKADRHEGSNINNEILRRVAADEQVPLWDFDLIAGTIPGRGIAPDGIHLTTFFAHDWSSPVAFQRGYGVHNLLALMALDTLQRLVANR